MPEGFTAHAQHFWTITAQWLGWRPNEFWRATPSELKGALSEPKARSDAQGPSMEMIAKMLERERDG
ncbi:phage tail assembly chaperone [uncultured Erythrobacter sp.]